jgi:hypothetical protein
MLLLLGALQATSVTSRSASAAEANLLQPEQALGFFVRYLRRDARSLQRFPDERREKLMGANKPGIGTHSGK